MQLFYTPDIVGDEYVLSREESQHAVRVLRSGVGDVLNLTDGRGTLYKAEIVAVGKECRVRVVSREEEYERRGYGLTMAVAPTKNMERFEWFLEKATEAGVDRIIPIVCEHSERRVVKSERCEKIIVSAMKQSLKAYKPEFEELTDVREVLARPFDGTRLIAHCERYLERIFIGDGIVRGGNTLVLIGPEGDFSRKEIEQAYAAGFKGVSLGNNRYRTESAAVSVAMIAAFVNGR